MSSIPTKFEDVLSQFNDEIDQLFGKKVVSIILFGSGATAEYVPKRSDINFLVVLTPDGIEQIGNIKKHVTRWKKMKISLPLFLTKAYIEASLDSFPIEFFNMQSAYRVISGEDVLKELRIKKEDLRLQCEREMKGNLLKLRQGFIQTGGRAKALRLLIVESIVTFISIFRAVLFLKGNEVPKTKQDVLLTTCREFGLDEGLFSVLLSVKGYEAKLKREQLESKVKKYISEIDKLGQTVDRMKFDKKKKRNRRTS